MISDVLFDAVESIRRYQKEQPDVYADFREEIDSVVASMTRLLERLDTPPADETPS